MKRKFVQLTPLAGVKGDTEFYAVADDGTAWYGCLSDSLSRNQIVWTEVTSLPENEKGKSRGMVSIKGLVR